MPRVIRLRGAIPFLLLPMILILASCRSPARSSDTSTTSTNAAAKPADHSSELYVEVCALTQLPYFIDHRLGMEAAGRELGVRAEFVGPADYDMTAMIATLEQTQEIYQQVEVRRVE